MCTVVQLKCEEGTERKMWEYQPVLPEVCFLFITATTELDNCATGPIQQGISYVVKTAIFRKMCPNKRVAKLNWSGIQVVVR